MSSVMILRIGAATLALASLSLSAGCFGRANPRLESLEEDREGGAKTTFKYDDNGYLERATRQVGDAVLDWRLEWTDGVLSSWSFIEDEVKTDITPTIDADDRVVGWSWGTSTGDETVVVLTYDDADRLVAFDSETNNTRTGGSSTNSITWTYLESALEKVEQSLTVRVSGNRDTNTSSGTYTFEDGKLVELVQDVGSLRTTTDYSYDDDGRLTKAEAELFGAGNLSRSQIELDYNDDGLVDVYEKSSLVDGDAVDPYEVVLEYDEGEARGVDMTPAEIGGLWDLRGAAYTSIDSKLSVLRLFMGW